MCRRRSTPRAALPSPSPWRRRAGGRGTGHSDGPFSRADFQDIFSTVVSKLCNPGIQQILIKNEIAELCKGVHCVDLGENFQTQIYLQNLASIQPRKSPVKFACSYFVARVGSFLIFQGCRGEHISRCVGCQGARAPRRRPQLAHRAPLSCTFYNVY